MRNGNLVVIVVAALVGAGVAGCREDDFPLAPPDFPFGGPGGPGGGGPQPEFPATIEQPEAPPPISGGTLLVARDGRTAVAADPDRDRVWIADLARHRFVAGIRLERRDEPGRLVEDAAGRVHVVLRRAGAVATLDVRAATVTARRSVCPAPRGVAYEPRTDRIHVACAGGELVSLPAAGGAAVRSLKLDRDLRDVVVDGDRLLVSRLRTADVLVVEGDGRVRARFPSVDAAAGAPFMAWRMAPLAGGAVVVHQRARTRAVQVSAGGYGGSSCAPGIVSGAVTVYGPDGPTRASQPLPTAVLPVDVAASPDGARLVVVAAGNARTPSLPTLIALPLAQLTPSSPFATSCGPGEAMPRPAGEPVAVAFDGAGRVVVQSRQPPSIEVVGNEEGFIRLPGEGREDTGHAVFHANAGGFIACASCHAEGGDDGRVWTFEGIGPRRTQTLRGGLAGTEPFHWDGDMRDLGHIADEVFHRRMSGPALSRAQVFALSRWLDALPPVAPSAPADPAAVDRGDALFHDATVGCAACHGGPRLTNNQTVDVGTGGAFQVPTLRNIAFRAPFMHTGCAPTLRDRFGACGGGDRHGRTSHLTSAQLDDLVTYLETL